MIKPNLFWFMCAKPLIVPKFFVCCWWYFRYRFLCSGASIFFVVIFYFISLSYHSYIDYIFFQLKTRTEIHFLATLFKIKWFCICECHTDKLLYANGLVTNLHRIKSIMQRILTSISKTKWSYVDWRLAEEKRDQTDFKEYLLIFSHSID